MARLTGTAAPVPLERGITVYAPGIAGRVERMPDGVLGKRGGEEPTATPALTAALAGQGFATAHTLQLDVAPSAAAPEQPRRGSDGRPQLIVDAPGLGTDRLQVAMLVDADGRISWHPGRPVGGKVRFLVPADAVVGPPPEPGGKRGLVGAIGRKLLEILVFPIVEAAIGAAAAAVAGGWERRSRPARIRRFLPDCYLDPSTPTIGGADWDGIGEDTPVLLFVHGTFSTAAGGFGALPAATLDQLATRYGRRVLAAEHPTLSVDPLANATAMLEQLPAGRRIPVDIVAHSRGGLLARVLAAAAVADPAFPLRVRRIVYVATPNAGTPLADPHLLDQYVNRMSTMLNLVPDGPWSVVTDVFDGVLTGVKVLAHGAVGGLPGLAAMNPGGPWLPELDGRALGTVTGYGVSAEYEPAAARSLLAKAADVAVDRVFDRVANDCVVPSDGVFRSLDRTAMDVPAERRLTFAADRSVWHCSYFGTQECGDALLDWLQPLPAGEDGR